MIKGLILYCFKRQSVKISSWKNDFTKKCNQHLIDRHDEITIKITQKATSHNED